MLDADNVMFMLNKHHFPPNMWQVLATGLRQVAAVAQIEADHQTVSSKLIALVNHWVANDPDKSWKKLVDAMEMSDQKIASYNLAHDVGICNK